ncbi:Nuclear transport factor 2 [Carpediemonas membranifera]|uniref:Nuclear transport factor 2 n=1 Tax=Carpediemonas membranifera TaxID=201153 RepID=A0A8J6AZ30_9EUKA|nr:Nuclear transport factor 2 [Carpediemonas membranifera]|eukprot:KAG9390769.1 Nuclear transport factor 2 [Carpediemonas membranifera]
MDELNQVATAFVKYYYEKFDTNRSDLLSLYQPDAMLTFSGDRAQGPEAIMKKLNSLSFRKIAHDIAGLNIQVQPTFNNGMLVVVSGQLIADDDSDHPLMFSQVFTLNNANGQWFILNDVFNLSFV